MEAYARKYHVSGNDVVELFHENQVFEKMMIQHEYLHQISFEEAALKFYKSETYKTLQKLHCYPLSRWYPVTEKENINSRSN